MALRCVGRRGWIATLALTVWAVGCAAPNPPPDARGSDSSADRCGGHVFGWNEDDDVPTKTGKAITGSVAAVVTIPFRLGFEMAGSELPLVSRCGG